MMFLKNYNFTDDDLNELQQVLTDDNILEIEMNEERVCSILDYFLKIGISNLKDIILCKPTLFYEQLSFIQDRIEHSKISNIIDQIKENPLAFDLIGL